MTISRLVARILAAVAPDLRLETDGQLGEPVPKMRVTPVLDWPEPQGKTKNVGTIYDRLVNGLGEEHPIDPKPVEIASRACNDFEKMKGELEERLRSELTTTIPAEGLKACRTMLDIIDSTFEIFLCDVARADGPIKASEAQILNILLGRAHAPERYNVIAPPRSFHKTMADGALFPLMQLGQRHAAVFDYTPEVDPLLKCVEDMGHAIIAADDIVNPRELKRLSRYTSAAHNKAAEVHRLIQKAMAITQKETLPAREVRRTPPTGGKPEVLEESIRELHSLIGLRPVKEEVEAIINFARVLSLRKKKRMPVPDVSFHLVFSGNPGTGKTSVARIISKVYGSLGLLSKGHLVEVDRSALVGGYVGQTALKTRKVIEEALGGVLFVDEAYSLARRGNEDFGSEAVEVLLKAMEDHRETLVVIAAGYVDRMEEFLASNPGLRSRFVKTINFPDYSADDLTAIFDRFAEQSGYVISQSARLLVRSELQQRWQSRGPEFANARDARNFFELVISKQANRLSSIRSLDEEALTSIEEEDVRAAVR